MLWVERGITIPWLSNGQLWHVNVRRAVGDPKYKAVKGGHPFLFGADGLAGQPAAVLTEGEFDTMLLHQEASDLIGVASLGSASKGLGQRTISALLPISRLLAAYDMDDAGEGGAGKLMALSARVRRVSVPSGKDITEFYGSGGRLRDWVEFQLAKHVLTINDVDAKTGLAVICAHSSCDRPVHTYSTSGMALCERHAAKVRK